MAGRKRHCPDQFVAIHHGILQPLAKPEQQGAVAVICHFFNRIIDQLPERLQLIQLSNLLQLVQLPGCLQHI
jgi:hypothetical protein